MPTQRKTQAVPPRFFSHWLGLLGQAVGVLWLSCMLMVGKYLLEATEVSLHLTQATMPACALASSGSCDNQNLDEQWRERAESCTDPMQVPESQSRPTQGP